MQKIRSRSPREYSTCIYTHKQRKREIVKRNHNSHSSGDTPGDKRLANTVNLISRRLDVVLGELRLLRQIHNLRHSRLPRLNILRRHQIPKTEKKDLSENQITVTENLGQQRWTIKSACILRAAVASLRRPLMAAETEKWWEKCGTRWVCLCVKWANN